MNVYFVGVDTVAEYNCEDWRIAIPFRAMRRAGIPCEYRHLEAWLGAGQEDPLVEKADLVIYQRNCFGEAASKLEYWRLRGKAMVLDLDDAYGLMGGETGSPSFDFWHNAILKDKVKVLVKDEAGVEKEEEREQAHPVTPRPLDSLESGARMVGAVSSPSHLILDDWRPYGVRTYWLPNYLEEKRYVGWKSRNESGMVTIGGGGSLTHLHSWKDSGLAEAINQLAAENPKVAVTLAGDERQMKLLKLRPSQRVVLGWVPPSQYAQSVSRFDIAVVPLAGEYDRRRSWIKYAEYAVMGVPWIGTDSDPNRDLPFDGCGRRVINTAKAWYEALADAVMHVKQRKEEARDLAPQALEVYGIDHNINRLLAMYQQIIEEAKG
jgi:glycosyltransferase involved in cell wall biosynthesis